MFSIAKQCRGTWQVCRALRQMQKLNVKNETLAGVAGARFMSASSRGDYVFRQLFDERTWTFSYLLGDPESKEAVLIDPVYEHVDRDISIINDLGLKLIYAVNTHVHADHVTGSGELCKKLADCQSAVGEPSARCSKHIKHQDVLKFGKYELECRSTPGHTNGCMTFVWHDQGMAFTGDALLIRGCGRTDFQQGDPTSLYNGVHSQILSLADNFLLYPGHDYTGQTVSSVDEEKRLNKRLTKPLDEFIKIMDNLNLPYPKYLDESLPANLVDGLKELVKK